MAYSAIAVANAFIEKANERGIRDLSPMKLQKLVFFAHSWMLALSGKPLIKEPVKAWKYGPVIDSVYHEFKSYGSRNIVSLGTEFEGLDSDDVFDMKYTIPKLPKNDEHANAIINAILDTYGNRTATYLSNLTHESGSAWAVTRKLHCDGGVREFVIPNEIIKETTIKKLKID